ncbi:hypothetical protein YDYSG_30450 [Paenibacillus tyrfis]|uniref:hypothetical protein n=1 Tax=Paenibacillus TaxID=44249 RepID=UPI0024933AF5|nr:hypothetical protein [Paenibacillus tyrfis]GLI07015.1 hypothetical protein YDYSG_30450 [Paenibacillus tyrfis]GMX62229.1 hypothetical protein Elgi_20330 [Paenibacillus elgii]
MERYIGHIIEVIYLDIDNKTKQRRIEVLMVENGLVKAFCHQRQALRIIRIENILAVKQVSVSSRVS